MFYCNYNDPRVSNILSLFFHNLEILGFKKLIKNCYKSQTPNLFSQHNSELAIKLEHDGFQDGRYYSKSARYLQNIS